VDKQFAREHIVAKLCLNDCILDGPHLPLIPAAIAYSFAARISVDGGLARTGND
jgi:hypothetical protein